MNDAVLALLNKFSIERVWARCKEVEGLWLTRCCFWGSIDDRQARGVSLLPEHDVVNDEVPPWTAEQIELFHPAMINPPHIAEICTYLENELKAYGFDEVWISDMLVEPVAPPVPQLVGYADIVNARVSIPGLIEPDKRIIICAHYDSINTNAFYNPVHVAPGMDDNFVSVAIIMEIARVLKESGLAPAYTIDFIFFGAEEIGLRGSERYVEQVLLEGAEILLVLNVDMVAYEPNAEGAWSLKLHRYESDAGFEKHAAAMALVEEHSSLTAISGKTNPMASDSFWFFHAGFPAIYFEEGTRTPHYHSPGDTLDSCNKAYTAQTARAIFACLLEFAQVGELDAQTPKERYEAGFRAGSSSDATRPLTGEELVAVETADEEDIDERVRVARIKDLLPSRVNLEGLELAMPDGQASVSIRAGIITELSEE